MEPIQPRGMQMSEPTNDGKEITQTTDAQVWAKEWVRIAREIEAADDGRQVIDEGWMIGGQW